MGDKYIFELEDNAYLNEQYTSQKLFKVRGFDNLVFDWNDLQRLTPYTEPDTEQVREEAYEKGYKTAKCQCNIQAEKDLREVGERHYQKGLSDAWECARKIAQTDTRKHFAIFDLHTSYEIFKHYTATEAINRIQQYEQEKEQEIKVGDEVNAPCGKAVIIGVENNSARYVYSNGEYGFMEKSNLTRTGRSFPEIVAILEKMKE